MTTTTKSRPMLEGRHADSARRRRGHRDLLEKIHALQAEPAGKRFDGFAESWHSGAL